ncbi:probable glycosyltransferase At5g25310 [Cynara cardunculus var. scolymus]|uniref:probable glycosyltransferase At5g25310 n=1 Tax=Cynara cardunculus var. scolymus TaxID=59895 RepID=UPI000D624B34|nr:probable glycosyltransferase At5g25310 [Cynara cardunculus var. scolymus]
MKTTRQGGVSAYVTTAPAIALTTVVIILILSFNFFTRNNSKPEFVIPIVQLQSKLNLSRQPSDDYKFRAVITPDLHRISSLPLQLNRNRTFITGRRRLELELARARATIREAASVRNLSQLLQSGDVLSSDIYHNPGEFYKSYIEMEKIFKIYIYEEGELPIVHDGPCKDIYTVEGRFIQEMEQGRRGHYFRTKDADRAHVYFMPFSVTWMVKYLYKPDTYDVTPLRHFVSDYVRVISTKHPFWNKTHAADHFMLSCHDWGPHASKGHPNLYNTSIRVLCNANSSEGFNPQKDVSLPEINLRTGNIPPNLLSPPSSTTPRIHLAFFAGGVHGPIRPLLLHHWRGRDPDLQVYEYLPKNLDYYSFMFASKYCLCPSGYEVASPRIVESIYSECVPVIISENYVLPFSDVLKWEAFSIRVKVSEIGRLKEILTSVPEEKYLRLKSNLRAVRRHFVLNQPAERFDVFHMILHSVWLRRLNLKLE